MSDKTEHREPDPTEEELTDDDLDDVFGGRIARIAAWYTRNHIKFDLRSDPGSRTSREE